MAGGGKVRILDSITTEMARVVNGRLLVSTDGGGGGGPTANVNITSVGGNVVTTSVPVSGTVAVSNFPATQPVSGTISVSNFPATQPVSGTVAVSNFPATQPVSGTVVVTQGTSPWVVGDGGGSITVDGTVAVTGTVAVSAVGGTVAVTQSGAWSVAVSAVGGTVSVTQGTSPWVVGDGGGSLTVDGTVTVTQATHANLNATIRLQDGDGSHLVDVVQAFETVAVFNQNGLPAMFFCAGDGGDPAAGPNTFSYGYINESGRILVDATIPGTIIVDGTTEIKSGDGSGNLLSVYRSTDLITTISLGTVSLYEVSDGPLPASVGQWQHPFMSDADGGIVVHVANFNAIGLNSEKVEDQPHSTGEVGIFVLAVRNDTPSALAGNGDYIPFTTDSTGRLYVNATQSGSWSVGVTGTVAVTQSGAWSVAVSAVGGTVAVTQSGAWSVAVSAVTPGTAAANLGKAEDVGHVTGDVGVMALAVRNDAGTALAGTTLDYIPLTTNSVGSLYVTATSVAGNVTVVQATHANLKATVRLQDGDGAGLLDFVAINESSTGVELGIIPMFLDTGGKWSNAALGGQGGINVEVVALSTITPGTAATELGKAEDAAHSSGSTGVMTLAVRQDALSALAGTTLDYIPLTTDFLGRLNVTKQGGKITYRAATTANFVAAAGTAMFAVLTGSATRTIILQRIKVTAPTLTIAEINSIVAEKWSTAPTVGTATALVKVPADSTSAAATATLCQVYTAAPTEGTLVGTVGCVRTLLQPATINAGAIEFDFRNVGESSGIYLRGAAQALSLAFGAAPATAVTMGLEMEWTEEL